MARRYYTGAKLKTLLSGDKVLGRNLIKKARAYTGYLFDQLTENQKYRTQQWNNPDGSKIQVFVWRDAFGERAIAKIYKPPSLIKVSEERNPIVLYHGWLAWDNPLSETVKSALVYLDLQLQGYLDGSGTLVPDIEEAQYLIDTAVKTTEIIDSVETTTLSWTNNNVQVADNTYDWPLVDPSDSPGYEIWTGEARGMNQALLGAKRGWDNVFPYEWRNSTGWNYGGDRIGIFFAPNGTMWAGLIVSSGLYVTKLKVDPILSPILEWLVDPELTFSEHERNLLKSWLYAYATIDDGIILRLLDANDVVTAFSGGYGTLHPRLPWQWRWQPDFDSPVEIITTTTMFDTDTYFSKSSDITITFDESGVPSATISTTAPNEWGGSLNSVVKPTGIGVQVEVLPPGDAVYGSSAVVYRYTTTNGDVAVVTRVPMQAPTSRTKSESLNPYVYGAGEDERESYTIYTGGYSGYTITGGASFSKAGDIFSQILYTRRLGRIIATDVYESPLCSYGGGYYYPATVYQCRGEWESEGITTQGSYGHHVLLILPTDNGVALGWNQQHDYYRRYYYESETLGPTGIMAYKATFHRTAPYNDDVDRVWGCNLTPLGGHIYEAGQPENKYWYLGYYFSGFDNPVGEDKITLNHAERSLTMVPSNSDEISMDVEEWASVFNNYAGTTLNAPEVNVSWLGAISYKSAHDVKEFPNILNSNITEYFYSTPIGCI